MTSKLSSNDIVKGKYYDLMYPTVKEIHTTVQIDTELIGYPKVDDFRIPYGTKGWYVNIVWTEYDSKPRLFLRSDSEYFKSGAIKENFKLSIKDDIKDMLK